MQDLKLIRATEKDIDTITQLASVIWNQHYIAIIGQKQVDYMLKMMYSKESLREQLMTKGHLFYLISLNGVNIGFISVNETEKGEWFLNKFYIDQVKSAKGIGTRAFEEFKNLFHPSKVTLTVNKGNYKSINFYFKLGFKIDDVAVFDIGNGFVMDDFIMVWTC